MNFSVRFAETNQKMHAQFKSLQTVNGKGENAPITAESIEKALGYTPAKQGDVSALYENKADRLVGAEHAGKLMHVDKDGFLKPLTLGDGLEIEDGVLRVTGVIAPETQIIFEDAGGGIVRMSGVEFAAQADSAVLIGGATFTDHGDGVVLIN